MSTTTSPDWTTVEKDLAIAPMQFDISLSTLAKDVAGTRDIYPIHHDPQFAKTNGARDIFLNTMWYQGFLGRYVTDWAGQESFVRKLGFDMRGTNCPGDTLTIRGTVTNKYETDGKKLVDLDVRIDNQLQNDTVVAQLTIELQ